MKETTGAILVGIGIFIIVLVSWIFMAANEARVYQKLTGVEVTTWDAMFVQFRVIEPANREMK